MRIGRFKAVGLSAIIFMATIVSLHSGLSLLKDTVTIHSSGSIGPVQPTISNYTVAHSSEIRAIFIHGATAGVPGVDWELIAQTLKDYDIDTVIFEALSNNIAYYPSDYIPSTHIDNLGQLIAAAHSRNMEVHVLMDVMFKSLGPEYQVELHTGVKYDTLCPTKTISRTLLRNLVEELLTRYDINGFMFDYIRYDPVEATGPMCYCSECKAKLQSDFGETISDWTPFMPGGARYHEFMEWRITTIDELVLDMRNWMLAIKSDLEFSAAVWGYWYGVPTSNRWRLGQDFVKWVIEGWLDWVAPMVYTSDLTVIESFIQSYWHDGLDGPEPKIPLVIFLSNAFPTVVDPSTFKQMVETVRINGADGWAVWRYGGPGDLSGAPDIRDYLSILDLPSKFSINNVGVSETVITWETDLPASSKVEYSTSPLFTSSWEFLPATITPDGSPIPDFYYWNMTHNVGTVIEDSSPVTAHNVKLTGLTSNTKYYFRVQSQDPSGIATSKVYTFTTG